MKTSWPVLLLLNLKTLKHRALIFLEPTLYFIQRDFLIALVEKEILHVAFR